MAKCQLCDCESDLHICAECTEAVRKAREVKDSSESLAKRVGESCGSAAFNVTKWICKGVQQCAPIVTGAAAGAKKAWEDAKGAK